VPAKSPIAALAIALPAVAEPAVMSDAAHAMTVAATSSDQEEHEVAGGEAAGKDEEKREHVQPTTVAVSRNGHAAQPDAPAPLKAIPTVPEVKPAKANLVSMKARPRFDRET
jgi:hypothetical protein